MKFIKVATVALLLLVCGLNMQTTLLQLQHIRDQKLNEFDRKIVALEGTFQGIKFSADILAEEGVIDSTVYKKFVQKANDLIAERNNLAEVRNRMIPISYESVLRHYLFWDRND